MPSKIAEMLADAEVSVDFESQREVALFHEAALGLDARDFIESSVGRYVMGMAAQDEEALTVKIAAIRPNTRWRRRKIEELQAEREAILQAITWLCEAVQSGMRAEQLLQEERQ